MKVKTTIMLDEDVKKIVMEGLKATNMSLSGFINTLLIEYAQLIQGQPTAFPDKPVKDLTLEEFGKMMNYWIQKASEA